MSDPFISIKTFEELIEHMKTKEFYVEWKVTSAFGPGWIGSSRTIDFYLGDDKLSETDFLKKIEAKLIELIPIPEKSKDHVITGNGDISLKETQLEISYEWESTIPYHYPSETKAGKLFLFP